MYYVYIHYTKDTGIPFYVGKGQSNRKDSTKNRNQYWKNKVCKHGFYSEVVFETIYEQEALNREKSLIKTMKLNNIELVNLTDGGEGLSGYSFSESHKEKLRSHLRKVSPKSLSLETKRKLSELNSGVNNSMYGKKHTIETINKIKKSLKDKTNGSNNPNFKGYIQATNINTNESIIICGNLELEKLGFNSGHVSACIKGKRKNHKGYTFKRLERLE